MNRTRALNQSQTTRRGALGPRRQIGGKPMRKILRTIGAMLAIAAVLAITSAAPASALKAGYGQIGGYDRGGYEYSP
jgi:hypothetical protein